MCDRSIIKRNHVLCWLFPSDCLSLLPRLCSVSIRHTERAQCRINTVMLMKKLQLKWMNICRGWNKHPFIFHPQRSEISTNKRAIFVHFVVKNILSQWHNKYSAFSWSLIFYTKAVERTDELFTVYIGHVTCFSKYCYSLQGCIKNTAQTGDLTLKPQVFLDL